MRTISVIELEQVAGGGNKNGSCSTSSSSSSSSSGGNTYNCLGPGSCVIGNTISIGCGN